MSRQPNWYLHPLVAEQKRAVHLDWIRRNVQAAKVPTVLKTDLFEEAYGEDELLFSLPFEADLRIGIDILGATVRRAASRRPCSSGTFLAADTRGLPFMDGSIDVVLSNSTLDHFGDARDIGASIREMARVLRPGGILLITLDNPQNPLYILFRAGAQRFSYPLGHTMSRQELARLIEDAGLELLTTDWLIHNPRFLSTLLFLAVRRISGPYGDRMISALLRAFAALDKLPTRAFTAAFVAACGRKPAQDVSV
jgi:SAM-dependent methyltransferase